MAVEHKKTISVVAAVITRVDEKTQQRQIFCAQRAPTKAGCAPRETDGKWEFPGGKIEAGETPEQALMREIREELGATITVHDHICTVTHEYADFSITLHAYACSLASGELTLREHAASDWLFVQDLSSKDWAEADKTIVKTIQNQQNDGAAQEHCYFSATLADFKATSDDEILKNLKAGTQSLYAQAADESQIKAWKDELSVLRAATASLPEHWGLVFEYILPRERGRRPDVIVLTGQQVLVLEFKQFLSFRLSFIDQVIGYARDLREYQSYCRDKAVVPFLLLTKANGFDEKYSGVRVVSPDTLKSALQGYTQNTTAGAQTIQQFLAGEYEPLPTILQAARLFFAKEPLPQIRTAKSTRIAETLSIMQTAADSALAAHENLLMLVTGVPGAGKTLIGLQFTFNNCSAASQQAVMLSGNGPLVQVLQYVLKSNNFVSDVHGFLKSYGGKTTAIPQENIIIYDEAQRAWDAAMAAEKRGAGSLSEPQDLMRVAQKKQTGLVLVGLIGEGQEINRGEEAGIAQWNTALTESGLQWRVLCPSHIAAHFAKAQVNDALNLDHSLRSKSALDYPQWVRAVLSGEAEKAKEIADGGLFREFPVYISRDVREAKNYTFTRYEGESEKRYGLLASSKAKNLKKYGIPNEFMETRALNIGAWFADDASSLHSCCQLTACATEFSCQGLELDFPIVCWGDDFIRQNGAWLFTGRGGKNVHNPYKLRENCYRVLLTRGREGVFIFVPNEPNMNETFDYLIACGCKAKK